VTSATRLPLEDALTKVEARRPPGGPPGNGDDFPPGTEIGDYQITELKSEGGFACLYQAVRIGTEERVALKILHRHLSADHQALERLRLEAHTLNQLQHPNIVRIFECGEVDGRPFLAMEWLDGSNLFDDLRARGPMSPGEALSLMEGLCSALEAAHERGIIHRDVKAQNVMTDHARGESAVKLVDFGIVKVVDREPGRLDLTATSQVLGTPLTMAPEQILGQPVDARTDVYALGLLLYQVLTGTLPFVGANAVETEELHLQAAPPRASDVAGVPAAIDAVLARSLDKSRLRRYASVREFLEELREAVFLPPAQAGRQATVGVYVQTRIDDEAAPADDLMFDEMERVLGEARLALETAELAVAIQSADAVLGAAPQPRGGAEASEFRRRVLEMGLALAERLAAGARLGVQVYVSAHVADASSRLHRGRSVLGGELLRVRDWSSGNPPSRLVATAPMLAGIERWFRVNPVPGRPGRWVVNARSSLSGP
jgi:serine/threonine-protein kinase